MWLWRKKRCWGGPLTCSVCTCWLTLVVFSFKLVMESLARTNPLLTPLWGKKGRRQLSGCVEANHNPKKKVQNLEEARFTPRFCPGVAV